MPGCATNASASGVDLDPGAMKAVVRPSTHNWSHTVALYVAFAVIGA